MDYRQGYINVDFADVGSDEKPIKIDKKLNLLVDEWPWAENSVDEVVFRESLEHFNRWNGRYILSCILFILKPGGILDLTVPPAERQMKILLAKMREEPSMEDFEKAHERFSFWKWHDDLMGATHHSSGMDGDSHKTLFSKNSLKSLLEGVGFKILSIDENIHVKATK